jgi:hypothetical protein
MKWVNYMENMHKLYDLILLVNGRLVLIRYEPRRSNLTFECLRYYNWYYEDNLDFPTSALRFDVHQIAPAAWSMESNRFEFCKAIMPPFVGPPSLQPPMNCC